MGSTYRRRARLNRILLILSPTRTSRDLVSQALDEAGRTDAELVAVYIVDTAATDEVRQQVKNTGFLGKAPSADFLAAVRSEHERQGRCELERVERDAGRKGIAVRAQVLVGDFLTRSLEAAEEASARKIFVARSDRSRISRMVGGSPVNELRSSVPCHVIVHEENGKKE